MNDSQFEYKYRYDHSQQWIEKTTSRSLSVDRNASAGENNKPAYGLFY